MSKRRTVNLDFEVYGSRKRLSDGLGISMKNAFRLFDQIIAEAINVSDKQALNNSVRKNLANNMVTRKRVRRCKRCGNFFETTYKRAKYCHNCNKKKLARYNNGFC